MVGEKNGGREAMDAIKKDLPQGHLHQKKKEVTITGKSPPARRGGEKGLASLSGG